MGKKYALQEIVVEFETSMENEEFGLSRLPTLRKTRKFAQNYNLSEGMTNDLNEFIQSVERTDPQKFRSNMVTRPLGQRYHGLMRKFLDEACNP